MNGRRTFVWSGKPDRAKSGDCQSPRVARNAAVEVVDGEGWRSDERTLVRCRKCDACRKQRRKEWIARSIQEAKRSDKLWLVTGTFALRPDEVDMVVGECQRFLKRLRKGRKEPVPTYRGPVECGPAAVRYLSVVERGERKGRLHAHFLMFGDVRWIQMRTAWQAGHFHAKRVPIPSKGWEKLDRNAILGIAYVAAYAVDGRVRASEHYGRDTLRPRPRRARLNPASQG